MYLSCVFDFHISKKDKKEKRENKKSPDLPFATISYTPGKSHK